MSVQEWWWRRFAKISIGDQVSHVPALLFGGGANAGNVCAPCVFDKRCVANDEDDQIARRRLDYVVALFVHSLKFALSCHSDNDYPMVLPDGYHSGI